MIDNIAITELTFGKEYLEAIESKQVAQQEAERAKYEVEQAREAKKSTIIKAEASAKSIELVGKASINNPCNFMVYFSLFGREKNRIRIKDSQHPFRNQESRALGQLSPEHAIASLKRFHCQQHKIKMNCLYRFCILFLFLVFLV